ncbi:ATP-binding protein [Amycolatopsis halotolerans]|uniref:ATP-binding protein n=1 Tax=Amycolatopsis halotolerans TaxID=330083 RepID=A0ABV7QHN2_9PSEU
MSLVQRNAAPRVTELLSSFRVVLLGGARQTGKTTLVRDLLDLPGHAWFSFDNEAVLARAADDPVGFVEALPRPAAVDEFQRAGRGFLLAVKQAADQDRTRGQLLLTGSTNYLADRGLSETLAGRAGRLVLWPLSMGERLGVRETFLDLLFEPASWPGKTGALPRADLIRTLLEGGYPEIVTEGLSGRQRRNWFEAYVHDVVSREALRPVAEVRLEAELRRLLRLLAARTGQELVVSGIAGDAEVGRETASNYVTLLEALHLVTLLPAWSTNITNRAKRRPKVVVADTGLAADLCGLGEQTFSPTADGTAAGSLFETFVITEVFKQATWSERSVDLSYFRDRDGAEVDLIVEDRRTGELAGLEIKLTSTPTARHAKHLMMLRDKLGGRFTTGLVVHSGSQTLPLGDRIWAVPVSALWRSDS